MDKLIELCERLIAWIGEKISWLSFILILIIIVDVILRYLLSNTKTWILELEWHLFALIFLLGAALTLQKDKHVRVDLFYAKFSKKKKALIDLIGSVIFLIPWCLVIIYYGYNYGLNSLAFNEGSPNPGGLPARYIIKFCIAGGFLLLLIQAILEVFKNIKIIIKH